MKILEMWHFGFYVVGLCVKFRAPVFPASYSSNGNSGNSSLKRHSLKDQRKFHYVSSFMFFVSLLQCEIKRHGRVTSNYAPFMDVIFRKLVFFKIYFFEINAYIGWAKLISCLMAASEIVSRQLLGTYYYS